MARLAEQPPEERKFLIYLAGYRENVFDDAYVRMLSLPQTRDLWLVRDAAILHMYNNHALSTAPLLARLRRYSQRSRWLLHSPVNPGARGEAKPGYLCGEMSGLAYAAPIWSRYKWVLYSNTDVFATPEFLAGMAAKLADEQTDVDLYVDRFPGGVRHKARFSMEYVVFRTQRWLLDEAPTARRMRSAFSDAIHVCLTHRGTFPEDLLHQMAAKNKLKAVIAHAIRYPSFDPLYNARIRARIVPEGVKTELYPGAMWHNQNFTMLDEVLRELEQNASAPTPVYPNAEQRTAYPFNHPKPMATRRKP